MKKYYSRKFVYVKSQKAELFKDAHITNVMIDIKIMKMIAPPKNKMRDPHINRLTKEDAPIHRWYRFVLSFPAHIVRDYISEFKQDQTLSVLDPFCGTGTVLVEAKKLGHPSIGIESHPMTHFASSVKTNWDINPDKLFESALEITSSVSKEIKSKRGSNQLDPEQQALLLENSICPEPLSQLLLLRESINNVAPPTLKKHLSLALAKIAVGKASNLHFGPEVGVRGRKENADVIGDWLAEVSNVRDDLINQVENKAIVAHILHDDSRDPELFPITQKQKIGLVVTSPPYPNEKDYTRTTRLESVLLGFIKSREELRDVKRGLIRSNTRTIYKGDQDWEAIAHMKRIAELAEQIEQRRKELGKTSGFEKQYHRVVLEYFGGMARHLAALRPHLESGAHLAYVVGDQASFFRTLIRTGDILKEIALELGYEYVRTDLFRERIATATGDYLREETLILKWPG